MRLNFYLEGAGLILCIILWIVSGEKKKIIDIKDRIYAHMIRSVTMFLTLNMVSFAIIKQNYSSLMWLSELIICLSFWLLVWFLTDLNNYLIETIYNKNKFSVQTTILIGIPSFLNLLLLIANWGRHDVFSINKVDGSIQIAFNAWYKIPYILAAVSLLIYLGLLIVNIKKVVKDKNLIFFAFPIILLISYYFQYRFKAVSILGFSYSIILLLIYLYSFNYYEKIDKLTNLPNNDSFKRMIDYRIGSGQEMAIGFVSINEFKRVNHEYGYHNGDKFIKEIGMYLEQITPKGCIARCGGDTFGIILEDAKREDVIAWFDLLKNRFAEVWQVGKLEHKLDSCVSFVEFPTMASSSTEITDLLNYLNIYGKKNKSTQCIICDDEFKEKMLRRNRIVTILKEIMHEGKMYVKYQPIFDVKENCYTRGEALFRLRDGLLGDIPPYEFFPIAEENGYVIEIGYVLIDKVCKFIQNLKEKMEKVPIISVNFSRQQIMAENAQERILDILDKYGIAADQIAIELPEDVFSTQYNTVKQRIMDMSEKGFRFYLDGFGAGFLDLSHLMELPFEIIKINKNMIREAEKNDTIYLLVSAMTAVFEENKKQILGDGIESAHLKEICDMLFMNYLQGYYFSEPVAEEKATEEFLKRDIFETVNLDVSEIDEEWSNVATQTLEKLNWAGLQSLSDYTEEEEVSEWDLDALNKIETVSK